MRNLNSLIVPKYLKGRPFGFFGTLVGPFEGEKKSKKNSQSAEKKMKEGTLQSRPLSQKLEKNSG